MFKTITNKEEYLHAADVEKLPIHYEDKMEVNLFGNSILVEKNEWLWHLHLKLTNACNASCPFCVEQNSKCHEDAARFVRQVDRMLSEMEREGILYSVSLTGGEPLLFIGFSLLCDVLRKHDIKFLTMNTNGTYLKDHIDRSEGLFDFIDISRHAIDDDINRNIFIADVPTIEELKTIKRWLKRTKIRIQCVMYDIDSISKFIDFVDAFRFADDVSFRRLMKLPDKYGVNYESNDSLYMEMLNYAYNHFEFVEQTIQDYYVYEIWNYNGINITFSYSNMDMLSKVEQNEPDNVCREFIIHPNGVISGSWDFNNKVICK